MADDTRRKMTLTRALRRAALVGFAVGSGFVLSWGVLVLTRTPEPVKFLASIRQQDGEVWDIRACADCPGFILLDRGFLSPHDPLGMALGLPNLPSILVARLPNRMSLIPEVGAARLATALLLQWVLIAVLTRALMWAVAHRRPRGALAA